MREKKTHLYLDSEERRLLLHIPYPSRKTARPTPWKMKRARAS